MTGPVFYHGREYADEDDLIDTLMEYSKPEYDDDYCARMAEEDDAEDDE